ncbi:MAG: hypothetical protein WCJ85_11310, partial [Chitinophagaceae bacterium]
RFLQHRLLGYWIILGFSPLLLFTAWLLGYWIILGFSPLYFRTAGFLDIGFFGFLRILDLASVLLDFKTLF